MKYQMIICLLFFIFFIGCQKDKPADVEVEELTQTAEEQSSAFTDRIPQIGDDFKVNIYDLQERIKIEPENIELRKQFCETAYSSEKMVLITMGIARLTNPESGEVFNRGMVERAAKIDATRWALYATNWLMFDYKPDFKEMEGNFTRPTQVIDKVVVGDSLFLYLASDMRQ